MDLGIAGKVAIVSGATGELGGCVAHALAAEGADLVLFARSQDRLTSLADRLRERHGVRVEAVPGDMRNSAEVRKLRSRVQRDLGGADILVVNTGRPPLPMREVLEETDDERWEEAYRTQLWGALVLMREIAPMFVERGWGRIVAITSASVLHPMERHGLSTVFRAGVTGFLRHLANETAGSGVTVNAVCPASIETKGLRATYDLEARVRKIPVGRLGRPEELAAAVVFLASQSAGYITGTNLPVDGGQTVALF